MKSRQIAGGFLALVAILPSVAAQVGTTTPPPVIPYVTGTPNAWFDKTKFFLGEFLETEIVSGTFNFKNPTDEEQVLTDFAGSCQCVRAVISVGGRTFELSKQPVANSLHELITKDGEVTREKAMQIPVGAGAEGTVEVHMEMGGVQGFKVASLAMTCTDPSLKQIVLQWQARGAHYFEVTPKEVYLNDMKWDEGRQFSFVVESQARPDFELLDHLPVPDYVKVEKERITLPDNTKAWRVSGEYGPNAAPAQGGVNLRFKTNWDGKEVSLPVLALVDAPFDIQPGTFFSFGKVAKGKGAEFEITITPKIDFDLKLEQIEFPKLTIDPKYISASTEMREKTLVVTVRLSPEAEGAVLLRGSIEMRFNHPSMEYKSFSFNGILR